LALRKEYMLRLQLQNQQRILEQLDHLAAQLCELRMMRESVKPIRPVSPSPPSWFTDEKETPLSKLRRGTVPSPAKRVKPTPSVVSTLPHFTAAEIIPTSTATNNGVVIEELNEWHNTNNLINQYLGPSETRGFPDERSEPS